MSWQHAKEQYIAVREPIEKLGATLIAVSKTWPIEALQAVYDAGCRDFGENRVQELQEKQPHLPGDIRWHLIGHLQKNKVKYIAPYIHLIHSVDSWELLIEIQKQAAKNNRIIQVLLQIYIAEEETKFGLDFEEAKTILSPQNLNLLPNISIVGFMGMATFTDNPTQIAAEFLSLKNFSEEMERYIKAPNFKVEVLSMGMSSDYEIALKQGSTMVRIGSSIFGKRP